MEQKNQNHQIPTGSISRILRQHYVHAEDLTEVFKYGTLSAIREGERQAMFAQGLKDIDFGRAEAEKMVKTAPIKMLVMALGFSLVFCFSDYLFGQSMLDRLALFGRLGNAFFGLLCGLGLINFFNGSWVIFKLMPALERNVRPNIIHDFFTLFFIVSKNNQDAGTWLSVEDIKNIIKDVKGAEYESIQISKFLEREVDRAYLIKKREEDIDLYLLGFTE